MVLFMNMENINRHERYRDDLADDLNQVRKEDKELAKSILDEEKDTTRYEQAKQEHLKNRDRLLSMIEETLNSNLFTDENLKSGAVEIKVDTEPDNRIEYDFEIEKETRYVIESQDPEKYNWENHVTDTYDESGRARVRIKNGSPRLSLKVPLFSKDTEISKACLRLEFKPINDSQSEDLLRVKELIMEEAGAQNSEKWGAKITMKNGKNVWINRNSGGKWWIEVDEIEDFDPPEDIKVISTEKSSVKTQTDQS